jgi:hypothetical protein
MTGSVIVFFFLSYFIDWKGLNFRIELFNFFYDPLFYICLTLNLFTQMAYRVANKNNEENIRFVQFSSFITISLIPIFSLFFGFLFLTHENVLAINYNNSFEPFLFSLALFAFSFFIFRDKYKNKSLKRLDIIILTILLSSISSVIFIKLLQQYNTIAFYSCSMVFNSLFWVAFIFKNKEYQYVNKSNIMVLPICGILYLIYSYLNIYIINNLPVEFIAIIRTLTGVLIAFAFDKYNGTKNIFKVKDFILLTLMFSTLFIFKF